jgi:hypothetical protein
MRSTSSSAGLPSHPQEQEMCVSAIGYPLSARLPLSRPWLFAFVVVLARLVGSLWMVLGIGFI